MDCHGRIIFNVRTRALGAPSASSALFAAVGGDWMDIMVNNLDDDLRRIAECETVSFDACDTLIFARPSPDETMTAACRALGLPMDIERARRFYGAVVGGYTDILVEARANGEPLSGEAKRAAWTDAFLSADGCPVADEDGKNDLEKELGMFRFIWRAAPGAAEILRAIRASGRRAVVTSNFDLLLAEVLVGVGLWNLFDAVTPSAEAGFEKPDPRIFDYSLKKIDASEETAIHVGDSAFDVIGAREAGLAAVLLKTPMPGWAGKSPRIRPVVEIDSLPELAILLGAPPGDMP